MRVLGAVSGLGGINTALEGVPVRYTLKTSNTTPWAALTLPP